MKIAFIGLGNMGGGMAANLVNAGHAVNAFDLSEEALATAKSNGCATFTDASEAVQGVDGVVTMLPNGAIVKSVYEASVIGKAPAGAVLLDCSTIDVATAKEVIATAEAAGYDMVDAPVSGGIAAANGGTLTFMVGGEFGAVECLTPLFKIMGTEVNHLGGIGSGMTCKVINNFVAITGVAAVRKAIIAARALGMDPRTLLEIMKSSSGSTWYGDNIDRISWSREGYDPSNTIGIIEKDMLSFLDAVTSNPDVEVKDFAASVLEVVRSMEPLDF